MVAVSPALKRSYLQTHLIIFFRFRQETSHRFLYYILLLYSSIFGSVLRLDVWRRVFLPIPSLEAMKSAHFWVHYETSGSVFLCSHRPGGSIINAFPLIPCKQKDLVNSVQWTDTIIRKMFSANAVKTYSEKALIVTSPQYTDQPLTLPVSFSLTL